MFQHDISRVVACDQETAFDFMTDPRNDPKWWKGVHQTVVTSDSDHGVGTTYRQRCSVLGMRFWIDFEVTEYDRPNFIHIKTTSGPTPFDTRYTFEPAPDGGTRLAMVGVVGAGGFVFKLAGQLFKWAIERQEEKFFDNLKALLDGKAIPQARA